MLVVIINVRTVINSNKKKIIGLYIYNSIVLGWRRPSHLPPLLEQCGSNAWLMASTPPSTATGEVWQQCLDDGAHPTFHRYWSSVTAMLDWWRPLHLPPLLEKCGSNAWLMAPTRPSTATGEVRQHCLVDGANSTFHRYWSSVAVIPRFIVPCTLMETVQNWVTAA